MIYFFSIVKLWDFLFKEISDNNKAILDKQLVKGNKNMDNSNNNIR